MGSSKKHKKHKDRKHSSSNLCDESNHSFNSISNNSVISGEQGPLKLVLRVPGASNSPHMSPSVIQNQEYNQGEMMQLGGLEGNVHSDGRPYSSSSKKMKKKKSKKKHKKHSHHHSHHHHSHHHRHKSSCSHHSSKSSSSTPNLMNALPPVPTSHVQTTNQLQPPYLMNSSSNNLDFSQDMQHQQQNINLIDQQQILPNLSSIPQQSIPQQSTNQQQQFSNLSSKQSQSLMIDQSVSLQNTNLTSPPQPQITSPNNCSFNNNSNELMNNNNIYNPNANYNMNNYGNNMINLNEPSNNLQNTINNLNTNTNMNNNNMINHLNVVSPPPISTNNFITPNQQPQFTPTAETSPMSANQLITINNNLNNQQSPIQQSTIQQSQIQTQVQQQPSQNQQQPCIQKSTSNINQQQQLARTPIGVKPIVKTQFQSLLGYLLKQLEKRDSQEFFFYPVTDLIAPGYSSIITKPMDFSKIRHKINLNSYENLIQFRSDVKLMCDNAMTYNRQDTIYFKAAKKLWHYARDKIFNRDSVLELVKLYQGVTNYELGLTCADYSDSEQLNVPVYDDFSHINEQMVNAQFELMQQSKDEEPELTSDQILEEVRKSAQVAAERLSLEKPKGSKYTLLRQLDDGTTSLAIVGSTINGYQEEKYVNLESLIGKLKDGSPHLPSYKESELNLAKPIETLESSPFSSYLPSSDSTKSNLTDKESALLLSTYGDDVGLNYSQSLLKFASDSDYVLTMVDSLLDALTSGQHTKVMNDLKENKLTEDKMETSVSTNEDIEMQDTDNKLDLDKKLNETNKLVNNLETIQNQRLSSSTQPIKPNKEEIKVAHLLTNKLTELISTYTTPADITDIKSIRKCLGVKENFFN